MLGSGERPCSTKSNLPAGLRIRRISFSAATGCGIEHKVHVIRTVSKTASVTEAVRPTLAAAIPEQRQPRPAHGPAEGVLGMDRSQKHDRRSGHIAAG